MKMVKSLLLGSAAGLFAVAGAQAADLPVKAKPVEYVKVCSLYGAGFYYIPGTDTCIKIGGFVRTEWLHNAAGSFSTYVNGADALYTRNTNTLRNRSRIITSFDVRSQTEYGTLRAYARAGWQWTSQDPTFGGSSGTVYLDRAFIQFAGFTFGKTQSFFDFFCTGCYSLSTNFVYADTGGSGTPVAAYTAQFGNGVSATLSIEDGTERKNPIVSLDLVQRTASVTSGNLPGTSVNGPFVVGTSNLDSSEGYKVPDIVGALRVDQAWGSAQISGAAHYLAASYYTTGVGGTSQNQANGHPGDTWGWAANAGLTLKMPWDPKDTLSMQGTYCDGATRYCVNNSAGLNPLNGLMSNMVNTNTVAAAWADDAFFVTGGGLEKSKMWSAVAAFEHYWTPSLRQSVYGGYASYDANSASVDARMCGGGSGCMDWNAWQVGSRLLWNPVANLDIGLDVMYTKVDGTNCARAAGSSAAAGGTVGAVSCGTVAVGAPIASTLNLGSTDVWSGVFRVQRNFWP